MMVPGLNDLVYVMGVGQCAWSYSFHWSRFLGFKAIYPVCNWDGLGVYAIDSVNPRLLAQREWLVINSAILGRSCTYSLLEVVSRFTLKSVRIGSTPVLKIALPSSPLPEHRSDRIMLAGALTLGLVSTTSSLPLRLGRRLGSELVGQCATHVVPGTLWVVGGHTLRRGWSRWLELQVQ